MNERGGKIGSLYNINDQKLAEQALQRANDELENRVQKRTAELAQSNQHLQYEVEERRQAQEELKEVFIKLKQTQEDLLAAEREGC